MSPKILDMATLLPKIYDFRKKGKTIVFTNGCFDIIHAGHVRYLHAAKQEGDILIVGLNSDKSVQLIKDKNRPIISEKYRAEVLAGLEAVDYVTIFNEMDPLQLICAIKPDVLVKGSDWKEKDIIGAEAVKGRGGKVVRVDLLQGLSTSLIIQTIIDKNSCL
jgi:D-beta-D-heptose 7-phosphate kinase/D-beta-D-heptose 1-phosphate adenosyltransferase